MPFNVQWQLSSRVDWRPDSRLTIWVGFGRRFGDRFRSELAEYQNLSVEEAASLAMMIAQEQCGAPGEATEQTEEGGAPQADAEEDEMQALGAREDETE